MAFIDQHRDYREPGGLRWGVEPICTVLSEHGLPIAPSTFYEWVDRQPTRRQLADAALVAVIRAQREDKKTGAFVQTLGARKMWIRLRGQGHDVARCTVERVMREQGWEGAAYGSKHRTTIPHPGHDRAADLVVEERRRTTVTGRLPDEKAAVAHSGVVVKATTVGGSWPCTNVACPVGVSLTRTVEGPRAEPGLT